MMSQIAYALELNAEVVSQTPQQLTLRYQTLNRSEDLVYLFVPVLHFVSGATAVKLATSGWLSLEGQHTARLTMGLVAPPAYISVARRPPPVVTPVAAGKTHEGLIELPLPLLESSPYFASQECAPPQLRSIVEMRVEIGWVEARSNMAFQNVKIEDRDYQRLMGGWGAPTQRVSTASVPVRGVALCPNSAERFDRAQLQP